MPYESDLTKFIREYLKDHPEEVTSQKKGRAIWWEPAERTAPDPARHSPRSGGAEYTFEPLSEDDKAKP